MTKRAQWLKNYFFRTEDHPYNILERTITGFVKRDMVVLDAGCGYTAPVLRKFKGLGCRLIGVDLVDFKGQDGELELYRTDLADLPLSDSSVDLVYSRSVMEHVTEPEKVYREFSRVLKPGGLLVFLTANKWDYVSIIARLVPNRYHAKIVSVTEGREEEDVFPTAYLSNTRGTVDKLAAKSGFSVQDFQYLGQYPGYFMFNAVLFFVFSLYERMIMAVPLFKYVRGWIFVTLKKAE